MPDIDKLIEARRRADQMADELERLTEAAELLDGARQKQEALIRAAEAVVEHAGEFAHEGATIIERLRRMDLERRLDEVGRQGAETQQLLDRQLQRLGDTLTDLKERNKEIMTASGSLQEEVRKAHSETRSKAQDAVAQAVKDLGGRLDTMAAKLEGVGKALGETSQRQRSEAQTRHRQMLLALGSIAFLIAIVLVLLLV